MKKYGWSEKEFEQYHNIFNEEINQLPKDIIATKSDELTPHEYLITLIAILDTPIAKRKNNDDINLCVSKIKEALTKNQKLQ